MISIICVYNDEWILRNWLLKSLSEQKNDFELITIDNTQNRFRSAAEALNWGGKQAVGDYLMFVHQDVDLCSDSWLKSSEVLLNLLPNLGIAGVAGTSELGAPFTERRRNTIRHRPPARITSGITHGPQRELCGTPIREPELVQTLDECLVIIPKSVFEVMQFDEAICNDWHLYAVDYCLSIKQRGFSVYVIPKCLHHQSTGLSGKSRVQVLTSLGQYSEEYYRTLERVLEKHKNRYKWIHTTCGSWSTVYPFVLQRAKFALNDAIIPPPVRKRKMSGQ